MFDIERVERYIAGYEKNELGFQKVLYKLKPIRLAQLQKLFSIPVDHEDIGIVHMIDCYEIHEQQAKFLRKYIDGEIDLNKYDYFLECYAADVSKEQEQFHNKSDNDKKYYLPPKELPGFPEAVPIKPGIQFKAKKRNVKDENCE